MIRHRWHYLPLAILIVSAAFGAVKTAKSLMRSIILREYTGHQGPGAEWLVFREILDREAVDRRIGFIVRRDRGPSGRPVTEYYYDAQYALVPYVLYPQVAPRGAGLYLVDRPIGSDPDPAAETGWVTVHQEPGRKLVRIAGP